MSTPDFPLPIALSMGDPAGIGPEIVLKALADPEVRRVYLGEGFRL